MKNTIFTERTFANCSLLLCQRKPHPQILRRKLSQIATKPRNLWTFSPLKVSRYTVAVFVFEIPAYNYKKLWRIIKSVCPCLVLINGDLLCGAWTVGLVMCGLYTLLQTFSCFNTDGGVSFILLSCWRVSTKDFLFVWMQHTQVFWSVNFSVLQFATAQNCTRFMSTCVCTFYHGWKVTESFSESLHFVSLGLCSWGSDSKLTRWKFWLVPHVVIA